MRRILLLVPVLLLSACFVDTTGISAESSATPHPATAQNAGVTVVEYADLECPACKTVTAQVVKPLIAKYGTQIRLDFKHFPIQSIHRYAYQTAQAAECAADQGKYWDWIDYVYEHQEELPNKPFVEWAKQFNLDADIFDRCLRSGIKEDVVDADYQEGLKLGVDSTPTFFVNGQKIVIQDGTTLDKAVAEALSKVGSKL
ncbi:MAG: DsbA family protein [Candidatus Peribacteraceae bacterium]|nr:DsbA family protein [Candidatus Peribacteraceae bacterium]